jgi:hypothetical protein
MMMLRSSLQHIMAAAIGASYLISLRLNGEINPRVTKRTTPSIASDAFLFYINRFKWFEVCVFHILNLRIFAKITSENVINAT